MKVAALMLLLPSVVGVGADRNAEDDPTTFIIGDLTVIARRVDHAPDTPFLKWDATHNRASNQVFDGGHPLPIAEFTCKATRSVVASCDYSHVASTYRDRYRRLLQSLRFSTSEVGLAGAEERVVTVTVTNYIDPCADLRCSVTPPPPPPPPASD